MNDFLFEINFFAKAVRIKRHELNMTQEGLSELIDCHVNALGRLERGQAIPSYLTILKIAKALNISPKDLMPY